jgi:hypothetical protein
MLVSSLGKNSYTNKLPYRKQNKDKDQRDLKTSDILCRLYNIYEAFAKIKGFVGGKNLKENLEIPRCLGSLSKFHQLLGQHLQKIKKNCKGKRILTFF